VKFAELSGPVAEVAENGDPVAREILERAGRELASLARAVISRLWAEKGIARVALTGGVLQGSNLVRRSFQQTIQTECPNAAISFAHVRPVMGALEIAAERVMK
jgi:N-acetylglucosamine kinase-like BadF-type ATPase